jgi:hypothetical protein
MNSEYVEQIVNLILSDHNLKNLEIVVLDGLLITESLKGHYIKIIPTEFYNPQDPMFVVTHESDSEQIGQVSFWEHNQLLLEVLSRDGKQLLMRECIVSSTEEIVVEFHEYFKKMKS